MTGGPHSCDPTFPTMIEGTLKLDRPHPQTVAQNKPSSLRRFCLVFAHNNVESDWRRQLTLTSDIVPAAWESQEPQSGVFRERRKVARDMSVIKTFHS